VSGDFEDDFADVVELRVSTVAVPRADVNGFDVGIEGRGVFGPEFIDGFPWPLPERICNGRGYT